LDIEKWDVRLFVKKNNWACGLMWQATIGNGIFPVVGKPGTFTVWMPAMVTANLLPGSYHFGFKAIEKVAASSAVWDSTLSLREDMVQILRSADMPQPKWDHSHEIVTRFNEASGSWEFVSQPTEQTTPTPAGGFGGAGAYVYGVPIEEAIFVSEQGNNDILVGED